MKPSQGTSTLPVGLTAIEVRVWELITCELICTSAPTSRPSLSTSTPKRPTGKTSCVVDPGDQEVAADRRDRGRDLALGDALADPDLGADEAARRAQELAVDVGVLDAARLPLPGHQQAAGVGVEGDRRAALQAGDGGVDAELGPPGRGRAGEQAAEDAQRAAVRGLPGDQEAAVRARRQRRVGRGGWRSS